MGRKNDRIAELEVKVARLERDLRQSQFRAGSAQLPKHDTDYMVLQQNSRIEELEQAIRSALMELSGNDIYGNEILTKTVTELTLVLGDEDAQSN